MNGSEVRDALSSLGLPDSGPALRTYTGLPPAEEPELPDHGSCICHQDG
ncbi:hypothetical protein [Kitasatospora sp. NPDC001683]